MRCKSLIYVVPVFIFLVSLFSMKANAIILDLDDNQIKEAINFGKSRTRVLLGDFSKQWTVRLGDKVGWATLYTGYHNLAFKARKAAVERYDLSKHQIKEALEITKTLTFTVSILGDSMEFGQDYHASLRHEGKLIAPIFEFAPDYAEPSTFYPELPDHVAGCVYKFSTNGIPATAKITLILRPFDGDVLEFDFDLSRMK